MAETKRRVLRWAFLALPLFILIAALVYGLALKSQAYQTARQFLLASPTIRQDLGTVQYEAILPWRISIRTRTRRAHEKESTEGRAILGIVLFGSRATGIASVSMVMKNHQWSVAFCELRRIGHASEPIPN